MVDVFGQRFHLSEVISSVGHQRRLTSGWTEVFAGSREAAGAVNINRRHTELIPPARSDVGQQDALFCYLRVRGHEQRSEVMYI